MSKLTTSLLFPNSSTTSRPTKSTSPASRKESPEPSPDSFLTTTLSISSTRSSSRGRTTRRLGVWSAVPALWHTISSGNVETRSITRASIIRPWIIIRGQCRCSDGFSMRSRSPTAKVLVIPSFLRKALMKPQRMNQRPILRSMRMARSMSTTT